MEMPDTLLGATDMLKNLRFILLFDVYGALLTEKQQETLELYYNNDLSLGEISEETGITRQGVMNCVKKSEQRLLELESQLGLVERFSKLDKLAKELERRVSDAKISDNEQKTEIMRLLGELREIL